MGKFSVASLCSTTELVLFPKPPGASSLRFTHSLLSCFPATILWSVQVFSNHFNRLVVRSNKLLLSAVQAIKTLTWHQVPMCMVCLFSQLSELQPYS
jgi:hypothetical protein